MRNTRETILAVDGMTCSSCVRHVEAALAEVEGVCAIDVTLREGKVRVEHDPTTATIERIVQVLDEAGYDSRPAGG